MWYCPADDDAQTLVAADEAAAAVAPPSSATADAAPLPSITRQTSGSSEKAATKSITPEPPRWRFVNEAKKSLGYSSHHAGSYVRGYSNEELGARYVAPSTTQGADISLYKSSVAEDAGNVSLYALPSKKPTAEKEALDVGRLVNPDATIPRYGFIGVPSANNDVGKLQFQQEDAAIESTGIKVGKLQLKQGDDVVEESYSGAFAGLPVAGPNAPDARAPFREWETNIELGPKKERDPEWFDGQVADNYVMPGDDPVAKEVRSVGRLAFHEPGETEESLAGEFPGRKRGLQDDGAGGRDNRILDRGHDEPLATLGEHPSEGDDLPEEGPENGEVNLSNEDLSNDREAALDEDGGTDPSDGASSAEPYDSDPSADSEPTADDVAKDEDDEKKKRKLKYFLIPILLLLLAAIIGVSVGKDDDIGDGAAPKVAGIVIPPPIVVVLNDTASPSLQPSLSPSIARSDKPSSQPASQPSLQPSSKPSNGPSTKPSFRPSSVPSAEPSSIPSSMPSADPSPMPSTYPSSIPSPTPSADPSSVPSPVPSTSPPTRSPVEFLGACPEPFGPLFSSYSLGAQISANNVIYECTLESCGSHYFGTSPLADSLGGQGWAAIGSCLGTGTPTTSPSLPPTSSPTESPSRRPTERPSRRPTRRPTRRPSLKPTQSPTSRPTGSPSRRPTRRPTRSPTESPSRNPTRRPSFSPTVKPSYEPTTGQPTMQPTDLPTLGPTCSDPEFNLCFAIDMSGSVCFERNCKNFEKMQEFSIDMINKLDKLDVEKSFSVVSFSNDAKLENGLSTPDETIAVIDGLDFSAGATNHQDAITDCQASLRNSPSARKNFILLITDGVSTAPFNDPEGAAEDAASSAKSAGTVIIPVFIAKRKDNEKEALEFMERLSSDGEVFDVSDFDSLDTLQDNVFDEVACG